MPLEARLVSGTNLEQFRARDLRIGVLHAGGPAPGGSLVTLAAALRAMNHQVPMVAFKGGYQHLMDRSLSPEAILADPSKAQLIDADMVRLLRHDDALRIKTARANPSKPAKGVEIKSPSDLKDPLKTTALDRVLDVFEALRIGALVSIGGDDTMKIANMLMMRRQILVEGGRQFENFLGVVHVPKTIDNDYSGVPVTFGFFSAAEFYGEVLANLRNDAFATDSWHLVEVMGRKSGALTVASAIKGEATYTFIPEEYAGRGKVPLAEVVNDLADVILTRRAQGKYYGVITYAEGMNDLIDLENAGPQFAEVLASTPRDEHGHLRYAELSLEKILRDAVVAEIKRRGGKEVKITPKKIGYEGRQVAADIYDSILCRHLGISAVDSILEGNYGVMVSFDGFFDPKRVRFSELVNPQTLKVVNKSVDVAGGFYRTMKGMQQPFKRSVGWTV